MSTPEKCPKCGAALKGGFSDVYNCDSAFEEDDDGWFLAQSYHCVAIQRDHANDTASAALAENKALSEKVKRLEQAGDKLIDAIYSAQCWNGTYVGECVDEFESAKCQP